MALFVFNTFGLPNRLTMKRLLLLVATTTLAFSLQAQTAIEPGDITPAIVTSTNGVPGNAVFAAPCNAPTGSDTILGTCDSGMVQINVTTSYCANWYTAGSGGTPVSTTASLQTGMLYGDSTFYVENVCPDTAILAPLGAHSSTYTGNHWARGYWFTAPTDFYISGLRVPTEAATSAQTVEVIRFNATPTIYPTTTNAFVSLGRFVNVPGSAMIPTCIHVNNGDFIAIFGVRGDTNSYHNSSFNSNIGGNAVTLYRTLMQDTLSTQPLHDVGSFTSASSISRTEMYYSLTTDTSIRIPLNVKVPQSFNDTIHHTICVGDTFMFGGVPLTAAGVYTDSLQTAYNCDSIPILNLTVDPCAGIAETGLASMIKWYPNPSAGVLTFEIASTLNGRVEAQLLDISGRVVDNFVLNPGSNTIEIPSEIRSGMYMLNLSWRDQVANFKLNLTR